VTSARPALNAVRSPGLWGLQVRGARVATDTPATVLLVDDDSVKRLALKAALAPLGLPIVEADSGQAALRRVMEQTFAVILLDVRMPEVDGFETAALIRTQRESEMTPIIFITAFTNEEVEPLARYVEGAVDFIFAPVPPEELRAKVSVFVNLYIQAAKFAAQAREVKASADHLKLLTDAAPIGIFRTDAANRHLYTNPRWSEITGVSAEEAFGQDWDTIISSTRPPGLPFDEVAAADVPEGRRYELWLPDSISRIVLVTAEAILGEEGEVAGWVGTVDDVTAETKAEEERSRFQSLIQNSRDVIAVIDATGRCSYVSPGVFDVSGFRPEEVIGSMGFDFIHPDDAQIIADHLADIATVPNGIKTVEVRTRTKSNGWIWIEIRATNRLDDPSIEGIVLNYHDITERRDAAQRIAQSESLLADGQALSHIGSFTWDMRTDELAWSDEQYRLFGFEPGSVPATFDTLLEAIHPEDRDAFSEGAQASMATGAPFQLDMRIVLPNGSTRWMNARGEVTMEDGAPARLTGMSHDITDRKKAEQERLSLLAHQEELAARLRMLLDSTGEGIYGLDESGACTFMNKAGAALLGGEPDEFVGRDIHQLVHHSRADGSAYPADECPIQEVLSSGLPVNASSEVVWRLDGTSFPIDYSAYPTGGDDVENGAVVAFQDVTLRHKMEQDLRQSEELFRGAFDAAQTGIALTTVDGRTFVDVNRALCEMLGYSKTELLQLDPRRITHLDDLETAGPPSIEALETNGTVEYLSRRYLRKDGETITVEISESLVRGPDASPMYFVTHANDVTERERTAVETEKLELQLVQAQKMEAVGQLAGGVAHDFNNILSVILNYAEFAGEGLESDDGRLADIRQISKAGEKAAKLVHQLLAFSRKEIVEERVINVNDVVTDVFQILSSSLGEDIDLVFKPFDGIPCVEADPGRIEQVLLNLAVNARDAMPEGGVLNISTGVESVGIGDLSALAPGEYVWVTMGDSGVGMDEGTVARIFEPFFTTKPRGEGSGMGLSSAYGIVEQAGGALFVDSQLGAGSTFSIYLPRSAAVVVETVDVKSVEAVRGTETILLVEDEDAVREFVSRILIKQGYEVVAYSNGFDALEYCRRNISGIDLLLTDVVMPRMSGRELSEQAATICTGLKTLFMSGYTDALLAQRGVPTSGDNLITKPFKPEELLDMLRSLLDSTVKSS
jgi:two-component system NtrC family sensor kinase